jgi:hypothetical protein
MAVTMLAFVPCGPSVSLPVLHRALAEDEDLDVRHEGQAASLSGL